MAAIAARVTSLDGRTGDVSVGAKYTAVAGLGFQDCATPFAVIEELTSVRRHRLGRAVPAGWTGDGGL